MQIEAIEQDHSKRAPEGVILQKLKQAATPARELKESIREQFPDLKDKQYKALLDSLVAARKIHGIHVVGTDGKLNKSVDRYAIGAPPSVSDEILEALRKGPLTAAKLKVTVAARVGPLPVKAFSAALAELVAAGKVYGRRKRTAKGTLSKTVEGFSLGGPPLAEFIEPVLAAWKKAKADALTAGIDAQAFAAELVRSLLSEGINLSQPAEVDTGNDQEKVLRALHELVERDGRGALIPIRRLRPAVALAKSRFDSALLALYAANVIILNHHDYIGSLSDAERAELLEDSHGNYYVGAALRGES